MRRKIVFLLLILGSVGLVIGVIRYLSTRSPKQGVLRVSVNTQATIYLDNKPIGRSPYEDKVDQGEYTIKLVPESTTTPASSWQGKIKVSPNLLTFVNADLAESEFASSVDVLWLEKISSNNSEITLTTNPDGASVSVDGEPKGNTPLVVSDVTPGEHTVAIASTGFAPHTIKVKTTAGYKLMATIKLALSPTSESSLTESEASPSATPAEEEISPTGKVKVSPTPKVTPKTSAAVPAKPYITVKETPTGFLRVRMEPSTSATEAGRVNPGDMFHVLDTKDNWYQIEYEPDKEGWVSGQYADLTE